LNYTRMTARIIAESLDTCKHNYCSNKYKEWKPY